MGNHAKDNYRFPNSLCLCNLRQAETEISGRLLNTNMHINVCRERKHVHTGNRKLQAPSTGELTDYNNEIAYRNNQTKNHFKNL
jgi:hypothetical protein